MAGKKLLPYNHPKEDCESMRKDRCRLAGLKPLTVYLAVMFILSHILTVFPAVTAADEQNRLLMAGNLADKGKFAAATVLLLEIKNKSPDCVEARLLLARTLRDAGYFFLDNELLERALSEYEEVIKLEAQNREAVFGAAVLLYEGGRHREAMPLFESLMEGTGDPLPGDSAIYRKACLWKVFREGNEDRQEEEDRRRCDICWGKLEDRIWQLEDGRRLCEECFRKALNDDKVLGTILDRVTGALNDVGLAGLTSPPRHLVSMEEISRLAQRDLESFDGVTPSDLAGLFIRQGESECIYILRGLPEKEAVKVASHELAHSWVRSHAPLDIGLEVNEGFAQWAAYEALLKLGEEKHAALMFLDTGPYGINFKHMEVIARTGSPKDLIKRMREGRL